VATFVAFVSTLFGQSANGQVGSPIAVVLDRLHVLRQTGSDTIEEREVQFTLRVFASTGSRYELRGNSISLPIPYAQVAGSPLGNFQLSKVFANSAEFNAALPAGTYSVVSVDFPTAPTAQVTITAATQPSVRVTNFSTLQAWDGGKLNVEWSLINTTDSLDLGLFRENGERIYTPATPQGAPVPYLLPGTRFVEITGLTATRGELLLGRITYGVIATYGVLVPSLFPASGPVRAVLEFTVQRSPLPPAITTQPTGTSALAGDDISLSVTAAGTGLMYQWQKGGASVAGATNASLELRSAQLTDSGSYTVVVTNTGGSVTSNAALVTIAARVSAPTIAAAPSALTVTAGAKATLSAAATGTAPLTYQWLRNGSAIAGATQSTLTFDRARVSDSGQYSITITNSAGTATSSPAELVVNPVSHISNLSILTSLTSAADDFTLGFVLKGSGIDSPKPVLIRAVGPSLAPLGVPATLADPRLDLLSGASVFAANDNWNGDAALSDAFTAAGAFAFTNATSRDAAILTRVTGSNSSVRISGTGSGTVLAELYDGTAADDFGIASPRFANVSVLKPVGAGLTAGFVIAGADPLRLLVRAIGPTLASFGVGGVLADPKLDLFQSGNPTAIASNDNWSAASNSGQVAAAAVDVGAFALAANSKDAALLVTLPPGSYTVQVNGVGGTTGVALVEVYEVP
jgi:hypothetical protein